MTTSTIRFVLIAALVVGGVVLINQAFPEGASAGGGGDVVAPPPDGGITGTSAPTGATGGPTGATGGTTGGDADLPEPQIDGVLIAVFNTTDGAGLADDLQTQLVAERRVAAQDASNAEFSQDSRIFYRGPKFQADAEYIANTYFRRCCEVVPAPLEPGSDVDRDVQVAILIGNDYAADQPTR